MHLHSAKGCEVSVPCSTCRCSTKPWSLRLMVKNLKNPLRQFGSKKSMMINDAWICRCVL